VDGELTGGDSQPTRYGGKVEEVYAAQRRSVRQAD
jgi:hypothetical protein